MAISYNTSIITDGLVFYVDAANPRSYPGTGATWYDISGKGYNATLVNAPTFVNKTLQFRSALNQSSSASFDEGVLMPTNKLGGFSIEVLFKCGLSMTAHELVVAGRSGCHGGIYITNNQMHHAIKTDQCWTGSTVVTAATGLTPGLWLSSVMVYESGTTRSYVNGAFVGQTTMDIITYGMMGYGNTFFAGAMSGMYAPDVDVSLVRCYNRPLTAMEVAQNFNAVRQRMV